MQHDARRLHHAEVRERAMDRGASLAKRQPLDVTRVTTRRDRSDRVVVRDPSNPKCGHRRTRTIVAAPVGARLRASAPVPRRLAASMEARAACWPAGGQR